MVYEGYVREAKDQIEHNKVTDIVMTLPSQQQKVLESLIFLTKRKEEITSGRLYDVYKDITKGDSVSYRRIFDFINDDPRRRRAGDRPGSSRCRARWGGGPSSACGRPCRA